MFNGTNESGKEFDVLNEDGEVLASFDDHSAAVSCAKSQPWYHGKCNIRRHPRPLVKDPSPKWWMVDPVY